MQGHVLLAACRMQHSSWPEQDSSSDRMYVFFFFLVTSQHHLAVCSVEVCACSPETLTGLSKRVEDLQHVAQCLWAPSALPFARDLLLCRGSNRTAYRAAYQPVADGQLSSWRKRRASTLVRILHSTFGYASYATQSLLS